MWDSWEEIHGKLFFKVLSLILELPVTSGRPRELLGRHSWTGSANGQGDISLSLSEGSGAYLSATCLRVNFTPWCNSIVTLIFPITKHHEVGFSWIKWKRKEMWSCSWTFPSSLGVRDSNSILTIFLCNGVPSLKESPCLCKCPFPAIYEQLLNTSVLIPNVLF